MFLIPVKVKQMPKAVGALSEIHTYKLFLSLIIGIYYIGLQNIVSDKFKVSFMKI